MIETIKNRLDDRGVSPVIGVILMVAITVILAAVIGSFVLGIGGDVQQTPQASISVDVNTGQNDVTLTHNGGDSINTSNLKVTADGVGITSTIVGSNTTLTTGDSKTYEPDPTNVDIGIGDTIRVVHTPTDAMLISADA